MQSILEKATRRLNARFVSTFENKTVYPWFYRARWNAFFKGKNREQSVATNYLTARPNPGAGIGHQMANWIAGYYIATHFGLQFAHSPFPDHDWEDFLGFQGESPTTEDIVSTQGYKTVKLPRFQINDAKQVSMIRQIIGSYDKKVCFMCEQDQGLKDQHLVMGDLQNKFYSSPARKEEKLLYQPNRISIAVHIRRGDIRQSDNQVNPNLSMRWLGNDYFLHILDQVTEQIRPKEYEIYIFTQDQPDELQAFTRFKNLKFCNDMSAIDSFRHMVFADVLVTSRSSFSYKPALLNRGTKICPSDFWHSYPKSDDWVLVNEDGLLLA